MPSGRWENANARFFIDGADAGIFHATDFSYDTNLTDDMTKAMGEEVPDNDASYMGGSFSMTVDVRANARALKVMQNAHERGIRERDGTGRITLVVSIRHPDGTPESDRFEQCIIKAGLSGSQTQRFSRRIAGTFAARNPI